MWSINRLIALAGLGALVLTSACATARPEVASGPGYAATPLDQFAIGRHEAPDQVALGVHPEGVTVSQREALAGFADRWRAAGAAYVTIQTPSDSDDPIGAKAFAEAAVSTLGVLGVPYERVRIIGYAAGKGSRPVVMASFTSTVAEVPDCSRVPWENLTATGANKPYARFGCAITANLAAQVADPSELGGGVAIAPADVARRMVVLDKYRDGKITSSDKNEQASGAVSTAVKP